MTTACPNPVSATDTRQPVVERRGITLRAVVLVNALFCRVWYRLRRIGPCTVPRGGPVIVAANHTCAADPLMLSAACPHRTLSFLIAEEFSNIPVARWFVRLIDCIPVRRDGTDTAATKEAIRRLRAGRALAIFIEGRIVPPGEQVEPKEGVAALALRTGATVIPAHLSGNHYRESVLGGFLAWHRTRVRFGPPVDLGEFAGDRSRAALSAATARIFEAICALGRASESRPGPGRSEPRPVG